MIFEKQTRIPCSAEDLFRWHEQPNAFQRLMPPGEPVKILRHDGRISNGATAVLLVGRWPFQFRWELAHENYEYGRKFCDVQIKGPFTSYRHEHEMIPIHDRESILSDRIVYELPLGAVGRRFGGWLVGRKFEALFEYRHRVTLEAFSI